MFTPLIVKRLVFIVWFSILSPLYLLSQSVIINNNLDLADSISFSQKNITKTIDNYFINSLPLRNSKDFLKYLPGVIEHKGKFHINGSRYDETDYSLDGFSILDHYSGEQLIDIPKYALHSIGVGTQNSEAINYKLKTGGNEFKYSLEHSSDNIGINSTSDFYSGQHRLGSYWYGYNETNFNAEGPIINDHLTFFVNANYKYMRDRNPQLYPGVRGLQLFGRDYNGNLDLENLYELNMPKGIVYGNSEQSYNILGKLSYREDDFSLDVTGIFENRIKDAPRNHVLDYFNRRLGKIEDNTGFFSISAKHKISNTFWYNVDASYSFNNTETYDEHLKDNYWAYGDSVANAEVGIFWERTEIEKDSWGGANFPPEMTRYLHPYDYFLNGFSFNATNAIPTNYSKSSYQSISFNSNFTYQLYKNNTVTFGLNINALRIRDWQTKGYHHNLARSFINISSSDIKELKEDILIGNFVNNVGYDIIGTESNSGLSAAPNPIITTAYVKNIYQKKNVLLEFELEYYRFDLDNYLLKDQGYAEDSFEYVDYRTIPSMNGYKKSQVHSSLNPKIHFLYSITKNNNIGFLFERNSSIPQLKGIYTSFFNFYRNVFAPPSFYYTEQNLNNDLRPVTTNITSLRYSHSIPILDFEVKAYYKKIENQTIPKKVSNSDESSSGYNFWTLSDEGSSTIYGMNISTKLKRISGFSLLSNLSLQTAEGSKSEFIHDYETTGDHFIRTSYVPLDHQYSVSSMLILDYLFTDNSTKINFLDLFEDIKISLSAHYISGHPYSIGSGNGNIDSDYRWRKIEFQDVNAYLTPTIFQLNFRLDKYVEFSNSVTLNFYIYAINLFNNENIKDVFLRSGSATDDGYDGYDGENTIIEHYGEVYKTIHNLVNVNYNPKNGQQNLFGEPRQIIIGIKLNL